jgi:hypothetical protein
VLALVAGLAFFVIIQVCKPVIEGPTPVDEKGAEIEINTVCEINLNPIPELSSENIYLPS